MLAQVFYPEYKPYQNHSKLKRESIESDIIADQREIFFKSHAPLLHEKYIFFLSLLSKLKGVECDSSSPEVRIGLGTQLSKSQKIDLQYCLRLFIPWKKGPFNFFNIKVHSEWNSSLKWERIKPYLGPLEGENIADIGCHNGYFMFKMLPLKPKQVVGFDPVIKLFYNFHFIQNFVQSPELIFEPLGVEHIRHYRSYFHKVLCLGILYHLKDPVTALLKIHRSLKSGGKIIVDCQGIIGEGSYCLFPSKKYAGAGGVWFVPTKECVINWLKRAQFKEIFCFYDEALDCTEQKPSSWAPVASLEHYLKKEDSSLTVEGYPAPRRFYLVGTK